MSDIYVAYFPRNYLVDLLSSLQYAIDKGMKFKIDISNTPNPFDALAFRSGYYRILSAISIIFPVFGNIHIIYVCNQYFLKFPKKYLSKKIWCFIISFVANCVRIMVFIDTYGVLIYNLFHKYMRRALIYSLIRND